MEVPPLTKPESHYRVCSVRSLFPVTNQTPSVNIITFSLKVCCNDILQLLKFSFSLCNSSYNTLFISHLALGNTIQSILWLGWATGVKKQAGAQTRIFICNRLRYATDLYPQWYTNKRQLYFYLDIYNTVRVWKRPFSYMFSASMKKELLGRFGRWFNCI
jgi:hypothetical protein